MVLIVCQVVDFGAAILCRFKVVVLMCWPVPLADLGASGFGGTSHPTRNARVQEAEDVGGEKMRI